MIDFFLDQVTACWRFRDKVKVLGIVVYPTFLIQTHKEHFGICGQRAKPSV